MKPRVIAFLQPLSPFLLVIVAWAALAHSGWYPPSLLVPPERVLQTLWELLATSELQSHLGVSLQRLAAGLALGSLLGLLIGVLMAVSAGFSLVTGPLFHMVRQVPSIALIPILILMLGLGEAFKVVIIVKAAFFPVALAAMEAVRGISASIMDVARVYRLPRHVVFWKVLLPASVPELITGLRLAAGRAWGTLVAAELIASESGLGQMMEFGRQMFRMDVVMLGLVITGLIGFGLDRGMKRLELHVTRWRVA